MTAEPSFTDDILARIRALSPEQRQRFASAVQRVRHQHPTSAEWDQVDWHAVIDKVEHTGTDASRVLSRGEVDYMLTLLQDDEVERLAEYLTMQKAMGRECCLWRDASRYSLEKADADRRRRQREWEARQVW